MSIPGSPCSWQRTEIITRAPRSESQDFALRSQPPLLFLEPVAAGPHATRTRRLGGAGRAAGSRPRPLPPRPAPSGHCRISIVPRHNFAAAPARSRRARRRKYSPCQRSAGAGGGRAHAGELRGAPGAGGPCAGRRRQPGHPAQLSGSRQSWAPARLSSPSSAPSPVGGAGGDLCPPVPGRGSRAFSLWSPRSRTTSRELRPK